MTRFASSLRPRGHKARASFALVAAALLASGCSVSPKPLTDDENVSRLREDMAVIMAPQEPIAAPVSMHEAMARAIKYNLDERVKLMEMAVANQQLDLSRFDMLPRLVAGAGYTGRNNESGSESLNLATGRRTGESTTATDRNRRTADLGFTWNILDFGVSYLRARQNSNLVLIADERRRRGGAAAEADRAAGEAHRGGAQERERPGGAARPGPAADPVLPARAGRYAAPAPDPAARAGGRQVATRRADGPAAG